mmetsp:Transcript_41022/g.102645  ORF Transcript_41022/g.102645 Transcript_41022/m.102645 type:complete len:332 (+) Transcript_41022:496-1491(+)
MLLNHLVTSVLGDLNDAVPRHSLEDGVLGRPASRQPWCVDLLPLDDEDVGGAHLLKVLTLLGVEVQNVVEPLRLGLGLGLEGGGVVSDGLDASRPSSCRANVLILNLELDGGHLVALEVGPHRRHVDHKRVRGSGGEPEDGPGADDEGAEVEGPLAVGGDPLGVGEHGSLDRLEENVGGDGRHAQPLAAVLGAGRVLLGAENDNLAVLGALGLHALEDPLPVVQDAGAGGDGEGPVGDDLGLGPLPSLVALAHRHRVRLDAPPRVAAELVPVHRRRRVVLLGRVEHRAERGEGGREAAGRRWGGGRVAEAGAPEAGVGKEGGGEGGRGGGK